MISTGQQHRLGTTYAPAEHGPLSWQDRRCHTPSPPVLSTTSTDLPNNRHPRQANPDRASGEHAMSADPVGEPVHRTDHDVLARLAAIDHRLHQISTQLTTMGKLLSQLDKTCANLETLIESLGLLRSTGRS
jgi:flagellin-like hook-associated protein FlgL